MLTNISENKTKIAYNIAQAAEAFSMSKSYLRNEIRAENVKTPDAKGKL